MTKKKIVLDVDRLANILQKYHHKECWNEIKKWFGAFGKNIAEQAKFLKSIMYTKNPLISSDTSGDINFSVLQGDIIKTKAAITNNPLFNFNQAEYSYYIIIPTSCSIQPNKYKQVLLARLCPVEDISIKLENNKLFYLPPIDKVQCGEYGFLAIFEEISYIDNQLLQTTQRVASLSLIGWHLLNAFLVNHYTRPSSDDKILRESEHTSEWCFYE
jgi:hypothetical protein